MKFELESISDSEIIRDFLVGTIGAPLWGPPLVAKIEENERTVLHLVAKIEEKERDMRPVLH